MLTKKSRDEVIAIGVRNRAAYLLEQYGYTMTMAKADGEALTALLPKGYRDEVEACAKRVSAALQNRALAEEESKGAAQTVTRVMRLAKEWRRTAVLRGKFAARSGHAIPTVLTRLDNLSGVPAVVDNMTRMVKMIEANAEALESADLADFLAEGNELLEQVKSFDATQEVKRLRTLPDSVKGFYYEKGLLYIGIKGINDWGRALHRRDPAKARAYDLSILYRHVGKRKPAEEPAAV